MPLTKVDASNIIDGVLPVANGGTGATTQAGAAAAVLPSQTGNSGRYLTTDGTNTSWGTVASSQWTTTGSNIYYNTGNVGIGTSSPTTAFNKSLQIYQPTTGNAGLRVNAGSTTGFDFIQDQTGASFIYNRDNSYTAFGTNNTERMRINSVGEVGIGAVLTGSLLHVQGNSGGTIISVGDNTQTEPLLFMYADATNNTGEVRTRNNFPLVLGTNNTERMRIDSSGNVYIGSDTTCNLTNLRTFSNSSNGYQKLPSGLIIQWGSFNFNAFTSGTVNFPIQFPNSGYSLTGSVEISGNSSYNAAIGLYFNSTAALYYRNSDSGSGGSCRWMAIGI